MGRQTRFYMMDVCNVQILAETFIQNGFELIKYKRIQNDDDTTSLICEHTRLDHSFLELDPYEFRLYRFRKPEYGTCKNCLSAPCIEWSRRQITLCADRLPVSKIYINTQDRDSWKPGVLELLQKDYKVLTKVVNKLTPLTSVDRNGSIVRARMDTVAIEYVKKGYHLGI